MDSMMDSMMSIRTRQHQRDALFGLWEPCCLAQSAAGPYTGRKAKAEPDRHDELLAKRPK